MDTWCMYACVYICTCEGELCISQYRSCVCIGECWGTSSNGAHGLPRACSVPLLTVCVHVGRTVSSIVFLEVVQRTVTYRLEYWAPCWRPHDCEAEETDLRCHRFTTAVCVRRLVEPFVLRYGNYCVCFDCTLQSIVYHDVLTKLMY
jgi:hypothetical protein